MTANGEVKVIAELPRTTDATIFWIVNSGATRIWEAGASLSIGGAITTDHTFKHVKNDGVTNNVKFAANSSFSSIGRERGVFLLIYPFRSKD